MIEIQKYSFGKSLDNIEKMLEVSLQTGELSKHMTMQQLSILPNIVFEGAAMCVRIEIRDYIDKGLSERFKCMRILECFTKEALSILKSCPVIKDIVACNDMIVAVFEATVKESLDSVVDAMSRINTLRKVLDYKTGSPDGILRVYFGLDYGECEVYSISDNILEQERNWRGMAIQRAKILTYRDVAKPMTMTATKAFYINLSENYCKFFEEAVYRDVPIYTCNLVNVEMNNWLQNQG